MEENYKIEPWKKYKLPDNGVYAPKGSEPTFHTENTIFERMINPMHPFCVGYIMHNQMKPDDIVPKRKLFVSEVLTFEDNKTP